MPPDGYYWINSPVTRSWFIGKLEGGRCYVSGYGREIGYRLEDVICRVERPKMLATTNASTSKNSDA